MGSNSLKLPYPVFQKSDFDGLSGQIFAGQEPPHTGGGKKTIYILKIY